MSSWWEAWPHADKHGAEEVDESSTYRYTGKRKGDGGFSMGFGNLKAHPQ